MRLHLSVGASDPNPRCIAEACTLLHSDGDFDPTTRHLALRAL